MRWNGWASAPVPATHCQLPLFCESWPSSSSAMKCASPSRQSSSRCLVRYDADDHARAVVHEARGAQLAHAGVDQRNSRASLLPAAEGAIVVPPAHAKRPHRLARDPRVRRQQLGEEVAPRQLARPDAHALAQRGSRDAAERARRTASAPESAPQRRCGREPRRRVETGQVARLGIAPDSVAQERRRVGRGQRPHPPAAARMPCRHRGNR